MKSSTFDADKETAEAPTLTIGERTFTGRALSIVEWFGFKDRFDTIEKLPKAEDGSYTAASLDESNRLAVEFLRAVFPPIGLDDPIAEIERRGMVAITKAFSAFFGHQLYALGIVPETIGTAAAATSGSSSPSSIAVASSENVGS